MEAAGRPTPQETKPTPNKLNLPSAVNIAIPKLLALTRITGNEHGVTFRYDKLGIIKANKVKEGTKNHSTLTTMRQRIVRQTFSEYPPILLHTHSSHPFKTREHGTYLHPIIEPGFNMLPGKADIELAVENLGALFLTASAYGVVAMAELQRGNNPTSSGLLSTELFSKYLQFRSSCRRDPSLIKEALQALADFWKPHGDVYVRFGFRSTPLDLVSPSEVVDMPTKQELAS